MNQQAIASVTRQIASVVISVFGVLSTHLSAIHLPPVVSGILTAAAPLVIAIEHFVSDPSTGTAQQAVKVIDATPEVNKLVADARAELVSIVNAAKVFVGPAPAPAQPPAVVPPTHTAVTGVTGP